MAKTQVTKTSEVRAQAKWVRCSARKARLVLDTVRGRTVPEARTVLAFSTRDVAREVDKVLRSAVANAEANHGLYGDDMYISACYADEGPRLKRWKPRARGRADRFIKGSCHITIKLTSLGAQSQGRSTKPVAPSSERAKPAQSSPTAAEAQTVVETAPAETKPAETASKAKLTAQGKAAAKPRAKKTKQGEAEPKTATRRAPKSKKVEE
ncbi:MAG: 50S ribosomal protein L22 [Gaiellaceae bacterium]